MPKGMSEMASLLGPSGPGGDGYEDDDMEDEGPPEEFMEAAGEAFPDMDEPRLVALYDAIKACR